MGYGYVIVPGEAAAPKLEVPTLPDSADAQESIEARLMGTWVLSKATTPGNPSGIGIRQKIYSPGKWEIIQKNPKTGEIVFHHGGSWSVTGDIVEQKVEFATEKTKSCIGRVSKFRVIVEKDSYTQIGIGNQFNEVWKRPNAA